MSKKQSLFDKLVGASKEAIKGFKKPFVKRSIQRQFSAAWDQACTEKIDLDEKLFDLLKNADETKFDISQGISLEEQYLKVERTKEAIKSLYFKIFGEEFKAEDCEEESK